MGRSLFDSFDWSASVEGAPYSLLLPTHELHSIQQVVGLGESGFLPLLAASREHLLHQVNSLPLYHADVEMTEQFKAKNVPIQWNQ